MVCFDRPASETAVDFTIILVRTLGPKRLRRKATLGLRPIIWFVPCHKIRQPFIFKISAGFAHHGQQVSGHSQNWFMLAISSICGWTVIRTEVAAHNALERKENRVGVGGSL